MDDNSNRRPKINSAVVIARLLGTEGYTDHVAAEVKRYWLHRSGLTERQRRSIERLKKEFGAMVNNNLSEGERLVIGKYFGLLMRMQFDTGLKIGIQAFAQLNGNREIDATIHSVPLEKQQPTVPLEKYKTVKGELRKANDTIKELKSQIAGKDESTEPPGASLRQTGVNDPALAEVLADNGLAAWTCRQCGNII